MFPEAARVMALLGADILLYPTAIGTEPILGVDSMPHWRRTMQGHAAANILPVAAANRVGEERVLPCPENGGQASALTFYGSSFLTDETGGDCFAGEPRRRARDQGGIRLCSYSNRPDQLGIIPRPQAGVLRNPLALAHDIETNQSIL